MNPGLHTYRANPLPGAHPSQCLQDPTALNLFHSDASLLGGQQPRTTEFLDFLCMHLPFATRPDVLCQNSVSPPPPKKIPSEIQLLTLNTWVGEPEIGVETTPHFCQVNVTNSIYLKWVIIRACRSYRVQSHLEKMATSFVESHTSEAKDPLFLHNLEDSELFFRQCGLTWSLGCATSLKPQAKFKHFSVRRIWTCYLETHISFEFLHLWQVRWWARI